MARKRSIASARLGPDAAFTGVCVVLTTADWGATSRASQVN
jgi:hypothetical protein